MMADTVVKLEPKPVDNPVAQNVVHELGRLLADAVRGDVIGFAFVEVRRGGDIRQGRALGKDVGMRINDFGAAVADLFFATYQERADAYDRRDTPSPPQPAPAGPPQEKPNGKDADAADGG